MPRSRWYWVYAATRPDAAAVAALVAASTTLHSPAISALSSCRVSGRTRAEPAGDRQRIKLEGELPSPMDIIPGCPFAPRCWRVQDVCRVDRPELTGGTHAFACHNPQP